MPREHTISGKSKGNEFSFTREFPSSLDDPLWEDMVADFEGEDTIVALAVENLVNSATAKVRNAIKHGEDVAQRILNEFVYGQRQSAVTRRRKSAPKLAAEDLAAFSDAQLEILRRYAMIPDVEEDVEEDADA